MCYKLGLSPVISCLSCVTSWVFHVLQVGSRVTSWVFHPSCHKLGLSCVFTSWVFHLSCSISCLSHVLQVESQLSRVTSWVFHVLQVGSFTCYKLGQKFQVGSFTCYKLGLSRDKLGLSPVISCLSRVTSWVFHLS